jgi:TPR repeat protein
MFLLNGTDRQSEPVGADRDCRKAADRGDGITEPDLGRMLKDGQGVTRDMGQAVEHFQGAAMHHNVEA